MDLSTLNRGTGGPVGRPRTNSILPRLPEAQRKRVAEAEAAVVALKETAPKPPEDATAVISRLAADMHAAAMSADPTFDAESAAGEALLDADIAAVLWEAHRMAVSTANAHVVAVVRAVLPEAYAAWTATMNDRLADLRGALAGKPSLGDPLVEFRAGGTRAKRAQTIEGIYSDLDGLTEAWRQGRVLQANGGPDPEAWEEYALFADDPAEATAFAKANPGCNLWDALASTDTEVALESREEQRQRLAKIARSRQLVGSR